MPASADDDVIVHGDAERPRDIDDRAGHLDIRLRGRRIAEGRLCRTRWKSPIVLRNLHELRLRTVTGDGNRGL